MSIARLRGLWVNTPGSPRRAGGNRANRRGRIGTEHRRGEIQGVARGLYPGECEPEREPDRRRRAGVSGREYASVMDSNAGRIRWI